MTQIKAAPVLKAGRGFPYQIRRMARNEDNYKIPDHLS